ncbi:putative membrane protein [Pseudonocardia sp. Ae168_Ps1]|uniref:hypothetical protein n=1 Tax=unclassified Pseudonocardia TaxID=2619320 RepID=UPI0001FFF320|nr:MULTISPECIES: hypothetical protein [unclassified Pseudonocardia]OLL73017.1 putative membrane protein [Pseudonocardia sp. Ae150A_Ps1]OLL78993.1 putative membrane protein [Pseudonocardia sp. Ae168_Ps1]OLL86869.1 putative membrane protein [Pseudonocardia sp. Ae263_Ps1]OLL93086.1 putative membrane protein [Pseudonocardia sp. Ae356_Ps1]OLM19560.1 putative membrane protein [Pseudonocardia sp. Ae707_Ps1]
MTEDNSGGVDPGTGDRAGTDAPISTTATNLFDLRSVIALLFGVYGLVLLIVGLVSGNDPENLAKTGGTNLNLDTGIAMLVVGALFVLWVRLRPLKIPSRDDGED